MHFSFFSVLFSPCQQLKRVFKHVLYLAESIIITLDFEKMNVLIAEPFNLAGECNKQSEMFQLLVFTDVTRKLSILTRFCFHDALEQLKTNLHTNFRLKRVLGFVIECA